MTDDDIQQRELQEAEEMKNEIRQYFELVQSEEGTINPEQAIQIAKAFGYELTWDTLHDKDLTYEGDLNARGHKRGKIVLNNMYDLLPTTNIVDIGRQEEEFRNSLGHFRRAKEIQGVDVRDLKTALLSSGYVTEKEFQQFADILELSEDYIEIGDLTERVFIK